MGCKVEHLAFALQAAIEVAVGNDDLVSKPLGFDDYSAVRVDDARAADQSRTIFVARLGDGNRPGGIHVGIRLHHKLGVEGAQFGAFRLAAIGIVGSRIVTG